MTNEKNQLAYFAEETLTDGDYTLQEAVAEAKRCLNCKVPQCRKGCPINNEIPQFIHALAEGNLGEAAEHIYHQSDLPAICGRVCPREKQCEGNCILGKKGKHMEIGKLERFVADHALDGGILPIHVSKKTSGTVALIGCGPASMAAAHDLAAKEYAVTIFESTSQPGGMLTYGIPTFRLHKDLICREADFLQKMGVTIQYNTKIGADMSFEDICKDFDAVFIGVGASDAWSLGVDNDAVDGVVDAEQFLHQVTQVQLGEATVEELPIQAGDKVIVVGAGNVAIDAARTALRLKTDVEIVYRRAPKNMKCLPSEYEEAKADGVQFQFYSAPRAVVGTDHVEGLQYEKQKILEDATMVPTGEFGVVPANKIIAAIGNKPELDIITGFGVEANGDGYIKTKEIPYGMTSKAGVFAAGDIVHKPATVVLAMREGRKAAAGIDEYIRAKRVMEEVQKG
ncbi:MAG: NAD(P)-dependent oxidoreductase [Megasphaera sp.]|nr:NAD(P)-dependent oxidoreductase [Megasphaera sp.]MCH4188570.1 NAD(P)-dependent oxidoreductase [Megasphaera sp.]MCH4218457.1 NAD(P)-dependent oxidoreductase [Megasphaera sp.]